MRSGVRAGMIRRHRHRLQAECMSRTDLLNQIIRHEGSGPVKNGRFMPYKDSKGILTIGYGRNLDANGLRESEARILLDNDVDAAIKECFERFPWFRQLDTVRQAVVSELVFNMGMTTFLQFTRTIDAIQRHDFAAAAFGLRHSKWYQDVKQVRGEKLAGQMESGTY
jgi:lysozyme